MIINIKKMEDFLGKKANELISYLSGSNSSPLFVECLKGKLALGIRFITKSAHFFTDRTK